MYFNEALEPFLLLHQLSPLYPFNNLLFKITSPQRVARYAHRCASHEISKILSTPLTQLTIIYIWVIFVCFVMIHPNCFIGLFAASVAVCFCHSVTSSIFAPKIKDLPFVIEAPQLSQYGGNLFLVNFSPHKLQAI